MMVVLFLGTILASYTHCLGPVKSSKTNLAYKGSEGNPVQTGDDNSSGGNNGTGDSGSGNATSVQAFSQTLHPITQARCVACHGSFQQPLHAVADPQQAHDSIVDSFKVNFDNIDASRMVAKLRDESHNCWSGDCDADADVMAQAIQSWKDLLADQGQPTTPTTPDTNLVTSESMTLDQELDPDRAMSTGTLMMEAGSAMLGAPMVLSNNYFHVPDNGNINNNPNNNNVGVAYFNFDIGASNVYKVFALVDAPSNSDNSFFVRVNNGAYAEWHIPTTEGFEWREVTTTNQFNPFDFFIPAGNGHRLEVKQREDGTKLSQIVVTDDPNINLNDVNNSLVVTITYDISSLVGSQATFSIDVQEYDAYSYKLTNPTISSTRRIRVKNIKPLINGVFNPQHATYTLIDTTTGTGTTVLSPRALLALKDRGVDMDRLSFSFEILQGN